MKKIIRSIGLATLLVLLSLTSTAKASEQGLVSYWKFDHGKGNTAIDNSSHKNNGEIIGATYTKGKITHCFKRRYSRQSA